MDEDFIFEFWRGLPGDTNIHPRDAQVLGRVPHDFDLRCLPSPFRGPLRTAKIVLLYASPGWDEDEVAHAQTDGARRYYELVRSGNCELPTAEEHPSGYRWARSRVEQFECGTYDELRSKIAFLNINAYKSESLDGQRHVLAALPSCRAALDWAQRILFPAAEKGERIVVCLRSANYWGLTRGASFGSLFAPNCTPGGFFYNQQLADQNMKAQIIDSIRNRLA